jgi:flagellar assembly protein FliH
MSSRIIHGEEDDFLPHAWQRVRRSGTAPASPPDGREFSPMPVGAAGNRIGHGAADAQPASHPANLEAAREALSLEFQARLQKECSAAFEAGREAAQNASRQELQAHYERLSQSIEELAACRQRYRQETEREVVQLSLEIARRILRRELTIDPEAILGLLRAGLESVSLREVLEVRVHTAHADIVRSALQRMGAPDAISVVGDPHLVPGAVCVETRRGGFDASAETQIEEIQRGFADLMERSAAV